jgi:hypothetical protein
MASTFNIRRGTTSLAFALGLLGASNIGCGQKVKDTDAPSLNAATSNSPIGPFQNTVEEFLMTSRNRATLSGPISKPFWPASMRWEMWRSAASGALATTWSVGKNTLRLRSAQRSRSRAASFTRSSSTKESPTGTPWALRKV